STGIVTLYSCIDWIRESHINTLNISGPRESNSPGVYLLSCIFLNHLIPSVTKPSKNGDTSRPI
ncbi:putative molybdenum carrier protein, partial [Legionella tunisiensis]|uniref:putative molybdenum carrier protein n=1 Tax=Legionella tunisiensis TaxID=1034944 RepID=UPI001E3B2CE6